MKSKTILGILLITAGIVLIVYYDQYLRPEREARELLVEGKMVFERGDETGDKETINHAINTFTRVIVKYPKTRAITESYFYIGKCYEKLKLYRLAYMKYAYLIKNNRSSLNEELRKEILMRLAHINILKRYSEEGIDQLYGLLNASFNKEFRSRVYTELGHTYLKLGRFKKSKRMFDISLTEYGGNEEAILGKARSYKHMGYDTKAYDLYDYFLKYYGAISQYTGDVRRSYREQAYQSGLSAFRRGRYSAAISFFRRILTHFPYDRKAENALYWIGESYFAMKKFNTAIGYFNRVLRNGYYHKNQDAQIKKGYAYFLSKRFDLAAREFQTYLRNYPRGRHASVAREWKKMSSKELLYRIRSKKLPRIKEEDEITPKDEMPLEDDEEVSGDIREEFTDTEGKIELENVAEL
jgi:TolA-binding protein